MSDSEIKTLSTKKSLENSRFDVFLDSIEDSKGQRIEDYLVVEPKIKAGNLLTGVAILPIFRERIGLIQVYRHPVAEALWEVPRGFVDPKESTEASATRELKEETGLDCSRENLESLGYILPDGGIFRARIQLFLARAHGVPKLAVSSEFGHKKFQFFSVEEVTDMAKQSPIQDPSTLVAFFRWKERNPNNTQVYP